MEQTYTLKRAISMEDTANLCRWVRTGDLGHLPPLFCHSGKSRLANRGKTLTLFTWGTPNPKLAKPPLGCVSSWVRGSTKSLPFELELLHAPTTPWGLQVSLLALPAAWAELLELRLLRAEAQMRTHPALRKEYLRLLKEHDEESANALVGVPSLSQMPEEMYLP